MTTAWSGLRMLQRVRDLIAIPELRSRLLSGAKGLDHNVRWAHVCELPDPTEWLGEGDVLMTTGLGIPKAPAEQQAYVARLAQAGIAGMMIGEHMQAPADISALAEQAEALGFPVILTEYGVPFAAVTRAIIDANQQDEFARRGALAKVYESARLSIQGLGLPALLTRLQADIQCHLYLVSMGKFTPWAPGLPELPSALVASLGAARQRQGGHQPMVRRHALPTGEALSIELPSEPGCLLVVSGTRLPDYGMLHHLTAVLGLEVQRLQAERERRLRLGSELLDDLLQQRLQTDALLERLGAHLPGVTLADTVISAARLPANGNTWEDQLHPLDECALVRAQGQELILLHRDGLQEGYSAQLDLQLGSSTALGQAQRGPDALREARLALAHTHGQRRVCRYAQLETDTPWLPRTPDEADRAFRAVLGALHDYDQANGTYLLHTLQVFLEENRSWVNAAQRLHVHKQTLVYRARRIEAISGRSLDSTADVATFWFALQSARVLGVSLQPR